MKKKLILFIIIFVLVLSSCAQSAAKLVPSPLAQTPDSVALPSQTLFIPQETDCQTQIPEVTENQDDFDRIVLYPTSNGYSYLPLTKPEISKAGKKNFNPDLISDYLVSGLDDLGGYDLIKKARLIDGRLYLTIEYYVYVDADSAYQYLKNTFSLPDNYILSLKLFSESHCYLEDGHMCSNVGWEHKSFPGNLPVTEITFSKIAVSEDAIITIQDYYLTEADYYSENIGHRLTTAQFSDYILDNKNENSYIQLNNVWFKYSDGVITGIAEEYAP